MKRKTIISIAAVIILIFLFVGWKIFGPTISSKNQNFFYIKTGASYNDVKEELISKNFITSTTWLDLVSKILHYKTVKPGRYKINRRISVFDFVRMLKNGTQTPVNLVITKIRTKEDLARKIGAMFECDSLQMINFLNTPDSISEYGLDTSTVMAAVMPYTYSIKWNVTPKKIFQNFITAYKNFWTTERKQQADSLHLTPIEVSILASIIDEETNLKEDKPNIASVYLNRLSIGMPLQADPTIKFALKDFALKRIYNTHLKVKSSYNTYLNKGLPPGPICTPSVETIDAVLSAPKTSYLYFVASSNFDGSSVFSSNLRDHLKNAKAYQQALDKRDSANKK